MPSTYSNSLRLELIGNGERPGTWGSATNNNLGSLIEQGITGVTQVDITGGDLTLMALNGATDEARSAVLVFTGLPAAAVTVTIPNANKLYRVKNTTSVAVTITTATGTGFDCPAASTSFVECRGVGDGTVTGVAITDGMAAVLRAPTLAQSITAMGAAPINSPVFTGTPAAPTPAPGTNNTQIATTAFVIQNGVPVGFIGMWSGAANAIPTGWRLCDGTNGTPNLTDRFVIGAGNSYAVGATGGSKDAVVVSHNHGGATGGQSATHTHSGSTSVDGVHTHSGITRPGQILLDSDDVPFNQPVPGSTDPAGAHSHTFTTGGANSDHTHTIPTAGVSGTNANLPPYYALCFIMKV